MQTYPNQELKNVIDIRVLLAKQQLHSFFFIPFGVVYVGRVTTMGQQILILSPSKFE
jgi:hypothetical protein